MTKALTRVPNTDIQAGLPSKLAKSLQAVWPRVAAVLPEHVRPDEFLAMIGGALKRNPKLLDCSEGSILRSLFYCAYFGLLPDGVSNLVHVVPYKGECTVQLGYMGIKQLVEQHPSVQEMWPPRSVYENDAFELALGTSPTLRHIPNARERGDLLGVYCIVEMANGRTHPFYMTLAEVNAIRDRSVGYRTKPNESPWTTDYEAMAKKTVMREAGRRIGKSTRLAAALRHDEQTERGEVPTAILLPDELSQPAVSAATKMAELRDAMNGDGADDGETQRG